MEKALKHLLNKVKKVKKGDKLVYADLKRIEEKGFSTQIPVVVTNTATYQSIETNSNITADYSTVIIKTSKGE